MPIYEYQCRKCQCCFEKLVFGQNAEVLCPQCGSRETNKLLSRFGTGTPSGGGASGGSGGGSGCGGCSSSSCAGCR